MTGYINALKLRFQYRDAKDEAYADLELVRYEGCIRDMFTKIETYNDKALISSAALKKLILERLPQRILEQMHTVDLPGKTDQEIINIITHAGRTAEKWEAGRKNLGIKGSFKLHGKSESRCERSDRRDSSTKDRRIEQRSKEKVSKDRFKKKDRLYEQTYKETEGIDSSKLERRKSAGECLRCAWPSDRKGRHRVKDCERPIKLDKGMASYPKAKEYQKMKIAGVQLDSDQDDTDSDQDDTDSDTDSDTDRDSNSDEDPSGSDVEDQRQEETEGEVLDESEEEIISYKEERNWWDSEPESESDY